jgi:hypothetical protein
MPHDQREMRFVSPVDLTIEAAASEDKPALVRVDAYSGGVMTVAGFGPVVLDVEGIQSPERVPLLADHENRIEAVLGSGIPVRRDGRLSVEGNLSRTSQRALRVIELHREGVPLQASVGAEPLETERIAKGRQIVVNGRVIRAEASSFLLVRRSRLKHVAIVANGADGDTSVNIAAQAAPLKEKSDMEFAQWVEAQGFTADNLDDKQTASLQAMYDATNKPSGTDAAATAGKDVTASAVASLRAELAAETARVGAVRKICAGKHPDIEAKAIAEGWDETKTELAVIRVRPAAPAIHAADDSGPIAAEVIEAALCGTLRTPGREKLFSEQTLEAADKNYRQLGLHEMILMAAQANGYVGRSVVTKATLPDMFRAAFAPINAAFSTLSLPNILSNVANKELLAGFMEEDQSWREVSITRTVGDFKTVTSYRMLDDMEYEELGPDGEIKHGKVSEDTYTRKARTYAKMFSLTRDKIIDDDLGAFEDLRVRLGAGAARSFNNVFWSRFINNATFFTEARGNFIKGAGTALDINGTGLQAGILAFRKLKSPDGKRIGGLPTILLVPPELQFIAQRLYQSTTVNTGGASSNDSVPSDNIHAGKYRPVVVDWLSDAAFTGQSAKAWFLLRAPTVLSAVVVSFLDGVQTPTVDMAEADFNQLGVQFRGYHDFGVDFAEWLAGIKAKGEA